MSTVVSMLVVMAGMDVVVSAITVVEASFGPVVRTFVGFVVDRV